jgi:hypothetical protein
MAAPAPGLVLLLVGGIVLASGPGWARADTDYFQGGAAPTAIKYKKTRSRTLGQRLTIAGLGVAGLAAGGLGLHFHLDSRDAAEELSSDDDVVGTWTADRQALHDRAGASGTKAIIGYSVGALLLGGAVVALWRSEPGEDEVVLAPGGRAAVPVVAPVPGGAVVGGAWSW